MIASRADGHNIHPAAGIAPAVFIIAHSHHRAVRFQAYSMPFHAGGHNICPVADITFVIIITSHSHHRAVGFQAYGMPRSCTDSIPHSHGVPDFHAALLGIQIIARRAKRQGSLHLFAFCQQFFCLRVVKLRNPLLRVLIVAHGLKRSQSFLVLPGGKQVLRRLILAVGNDDLCDHNDHRDCNHGHNACDDPGLLVFFRPGFRFLLPDGALPLGLRRGGRLDGIRSLLAQRRQLRTVLVAIQVRKGFRCLAQVRRIRSVFGNFRPAPVIVLTALLTLRTDGSGFLIRRREHGGIPLLGFRLCRFILDLALLDPLIQEAEHLLFRRFELLGGLTLGELFHAGQLLVAGPVVLFSLVFLLPRRRYDLISAVKLVQFGDFGAVHIPFYRCFTEHFLDVLFVLRQLSHFLLHVLSQAFALADKGLQRFASLLRQRLAKISLCVAGVIVQHFLKEAVGLGPIAVLQRHASALHQSSRLAALAALLHYHSLLYGGLLIAIQHLFHAADQVLDKADLPHVIGLQYTQLLRQVIGVHIPVAGEQQLGAVLLHQRQEAAPLVLHPHGIEILRLGAHCHHDFSAVQCREDIRLILGAHLVLQRDAGEKHPVAGVRQLIVDVLSQQGVLCPLAVLVRLFIADKDIKGLLILGGGQDALLHLRNLGGILLVLPPGHAVRVLQCRQIVHILQKAVKAGPVAGGDPLICSGVLHIFDTKPAQGAAPVGLGVGVVFRHDALING